MSRRLVPTLLVVLIAAACSGDNSQEAAAGYFEDAAAISTRYESAAAVHFAEYRAAIDSATAETGDEIFVEANQGLFANLATEFGAAITDLNELTPPVAAGSPHDAWLEAARALNSIFQSVDSQLAPLTEAEAVNSVVSTQPLADLQAAYRAACQSVAELAGSIPTASIACQPTGSDA